MIYTHTYTSIHIFLVCVYIIHYFWTMFEPSVKIRFRFGYICSLSPVTVPRRWLFYFSCFVLFVLDESCLGHCGVGWDGGRGPFVVCLYYIYVVFFSLFALPLSGIDRLCSVFVALPGYLLYYLSMFAHAHKKTY